ncbi:hypothetical protein JHD50_03925 [Sulfurimonas sp. MAG313]|nr:hypothetical protein [Sulfurimonas sp. MAG313]MDF1880459.1 hypothetical protein [Sulfurimonas sp. MAG313]
MEISGAPSSQQQVEVLKKSTEVQERAVSQLLNDSSAQLKEQQKIAQETQKTSGAALTGLGTGLDISA